MTALIGFMGVLGLATIGMGTSMMISRHKKKRGTKKLIVSDSDYIAQYEIQLNILKNYLNDYTRFREWAGELFGTQVYLTKESEQRLKRILSELRKLTIRAERLKKKAETLPTHQRQALLINYTGTMKRLSTLLSREHLPTLLLITDPTEQNEEDIQRVVNILNNLNTNLREQIEIHNHTERFDFEVAANLLEK